MVRSGLFEGLIYTGNLILDHPSRKNSPALWKSDTILPNSNIHALQKPEGNIIHLTY